MVSKHLICIILYYGLFLQVLQLGFLLKILVQISIYKHGHILKNHTLNNLHYENRKSGSQLKKNLCRNILFKHFLNVIKIKVCENMILISIPILKS